jgi:hypothetical protein
MAPLGNNSFDIGNSKLNYTYSMNFLIKNILKNDFKFTLEKKSQKKFQIMFQIYDLDQKVQGKKLALCS